MYSPTRIYNALVPVKHRPRLERHYFEDMKENCIAMDPTKMESASVFNGTLCQWCCDLLEERLFDFSDFQFRFFREGQICLNDWTEIERSSKLCQVCSIIWDMVENPSNSTAADYRAEWVCLVFWLTPKHVDCWEAVAPSRMTTIRVSTRIRQPGDSTYELEIGSLRMIPTKQHAAINLSELREASHDPIDVPISDPIRDSVSNQTLELMKTWIACCSVTHRECNAFTKSVRPSRLLDLEVSYGRAFIKLVQGDSVPQNTKYMTLSHCWGASTSRDYNLNSKNWKQYTDAISVAVLPKTFFDAIAITRVLGIRYLWIDSLCIIQDSQEDWAKESALMPSVYGNSFCNIAASGASSSAEGCFLPRRRMDQSRAVRMLTQNTTLPDQVCVNDGMVWIEFLRCPLSQRAWVFQERMLAPRTIHFGLSQVFWECNSFLACERFPCGNLAISALRMPGYKTLNKLQAEGSQALTSRYGDGNSISEAWDDFVMAYSASKLTYDTDRLVAMGGIVSRFELSLGTPLAGLWKENLAVQLLWRKKKCWEDSPSFGKRSIHNFAPSWSWASLLETSISPETKRSYKERRENYVVLGILEAHVEDFSQREGYIAMEGFIKARCYMVPIAVVSEGPRNTGTLILQPESTHEVDVSVGTRLYLDTKETKAGDRILAVPVLLRNSHSLEGLLLRQDASTSDASFSRCGVFELHNSLQFSAVKVFWRSLLEYGRSQQSARRYDRIIGLSESEVDQHEKEVEVILRSKYFCNSHKPLLSRFNGVKQFEIIIK